MKECIICRNWIPDDAKTCETCGFPARRWFLSNRHYESWMEQTVIPYRKQWETREEEKQREEEIQPSETENEQSAEKTAVTPAVVSKPKKKRQGLIAAVAAVIIFAVGIAIGVGFGGKQDGDVENIEPEQTETTQTAQVENTASSSQTDKEEEMVPDFDLNLFENIPLTTRDEMVSWLDKNGYSYEESGEPETDDWKISIDVNTNPSVVYDKERPGHLEKYRLEYVCGNDETEKWLNEQLKQEYGAGNENDIWIEYVDGSTTYSIMDSTAYKVTLASTSPSETAEQAELAIELLLNAPNPPKKKETLDWLEHSNYSFEKSYGIREVDLGKWYVWYSLGSEFWEIRLETGNAGELYYELQSRFNELGYSGEQVDYASSDTKGINYTTDGEDITITWYLEGNEVSIKTHYYD